MKILFVCTGNTCRSPMAEAILKDYLKKHNIYGVSVSSCGLRIDENYCVTEQKAITALKSIGVPVRKKKAKVLTQKMIDDSDYIVTMTVAQKMAINSDKVYTLAELSHQDDIPDPFGGNQDTYDITAFKIRMGIESMMNNIRGQL